MGDDDIQKHDEELVEGVVSQLMQHFDTVQVFVTRVEPSGETIGFGPGRGNWYARYGQVHEWLENGGAMHLTERDEED